MATDVVIAGGGPNGLLMACELALADVRVVVLERLLERPTAPKANGLVGRVVQALDYRGLYERFSGSSRPPVPAPGFQFGALPLDLSGLDNNALYTLPIPQRRMEELLEQRARELGVQIRRGHDLIALRQTAGLVAIDVQGPEGRYQLSAQFLVGADGGHSIVRKQCGIGFPGITDHGFVSRSGQVTIRLRSRFRAPGNCRCPALAGSGPRRLPARRTGFSPTGCSSRGSTGWRSPNGLPRRRRTPPP